MSRPYGQANAKIGSRRMWQVAAMMVAVGGTTKTVAEKLKITERTLRHWRSKPQFQQYVEQFHQNLIDKTTARLTIIQQSAVERLQRLLADRDSRVALGAVKEVREWLHQSMNDTKVAKSLERLEAMMPQRAGLVEGQSVTEVSR